MARNIGENYLFGFSISELTYSVQKVNNLFSLTIQRSLMLLLSSLQIWRETFCLFLLFLKGLILVVIQRIKNSMTKVVHEVCWCNLQCRWSDCGFANFSQPLFSLNIHFWLILFSPKVILKWNQHLNKCHISILMYHIPFNYEHIVVFLLCNTGGLAFL